MTEQNTTQNAWQNPSFGATAAPPAAPPAAPVVPAGYHFNGVSWFHLENNAWVPCADPTPPPPPPVVAAPPPPPPPPAIAAPPPPPPAVAAPPAVQPPATTDFGADGDDSFLELEDNQLPVAIYDFELLFEGVETVTGKQDPTQTYKKIKIRFTVADGASRGRVLTESFFKDSAQIQAIIKAAGCEMVERQAADGVRKGFSFRNLDRKVISAEVYIRDERFRSLKNFKPIVR